MKNKLYAILLFLFPIILLIPSCQKGEDILGVGYGELNVTSEFSGSAEPLLILVDSEVKDTLRADKPRTLRNIILKTGDHKVSLVNEKTQKTIIDQVITIEASKLYNLPTFYYTGEAILYDEFESKPQQDSMLVRFMIMDKNLPDEMDLTFTLYDYNEINIPLPMKRLNGVRKDKFSNFIQFPNSEVLIPNNGGYVFYLVEGYKAGTNEKILDISKGTNVMIAIVGTGYDPFIPNAVISLGIAYQDNSYTSTTIFQHIK